MLILRRLSTGCIVNPIFVPRSNTSSWRSASETVAGGTSGPTGWRARRMLLSLLRALPDDHSVNIHS